MRDAEVEDQAPAASLRDLISQVVADLHVAAPLACAGRDAELRVFRRPCHPLHQPSLPLHPTSLGESVPFINKISQRVPATPSTRKPTRVPGAAT